LKHVEGDQKNNIEALKVSAKNNQQWGRSENEEGGLEQCISYSDFAKK
jgi:hypothetical protein